MGVLAVLFREAGILGGAGAAALHAVARCVCAVLEATHDRDRAPRTPRPTADDVLGVDLAGRDVRVWTWEMGRGSRQVWRGLADTSAGFPFQWEERTAWWRLVHPGDRPSVLGALRRCLTGGDQWVECEYRVRSPGGEWRWVRTRAGATERDAAGKATRLIGIDEEVTAAREARDHLEQQGRMLDQVPVIVRNSDGQIQFWSSGAESLFGWSREEALGRLAHDLLHTVYPQPEEAIREQVGRDGYWEGRLVHTRKDGREVVVASRWIGYPYCPGAPPCVVEVDNDITDLEHAKEALRQGDVRYQELANRFRALYAYTQKAREEERLHIARDIHDVLGQILTGIRMDLGWLQRRLSDESTSLDRSALSHRVAASAALAERAIQEVRRLATELRPGILDDLGLVAAIEWQAEEFSKRNGVICRVTHDLDDLEVPPVQALALFRIFQETLTNVARHAAATQVEVRLWQDGEHVVMDVRDDGKGITLDQVTGHQSLGILGMRERAKLVGGEVTISGCPGQGTLVRAKVPLDGSEDPGSLSWTEADDAYPHR